MRGGGGDRLATCANIISGPNARIYRLSLDIPIPGYEDFITPWLIIESKRDSGAGSGLAADSLRDPSRGPAGDGRVMLVDPGPACGIPSLLGCLRDLGVMRLDQVLLTHVHVDHAGGVSHLVQAYPDLRVTVHPRGRPHLLEPGRLWHATLETLGDVAAGYGEMFPMSEESMMPEEQAVEGITVIDTPGHASHHQSYLYCRGSEKVLFAGEAASIYLHGSYIRPATPPRFLYDVYCGSLQRLASLEPSIICYGHYGISRQAQNLIDAAGRELLLWINEAREALRDREDGEAPDEEAPDEEALDVCLKRLMGVDPCLAGFKELDSDIQAREEFFLRSSLRGVMGYLLATKQ